MRMFVYGSLKGGFDNFNRYCRGVRSIEPAWIEGQLFQLPTGYPVLRLPKTRFLARGTADILLDIQVYGQLCEEEAATRGGSRSRSRRGGSLVHGVILTFANPASRLRAIDGLEEFRPGRRSRYERVLIRVHSRIRRAEIVVWTYVAGDLSARGRLIPTGRWNGSKTRGA